MLRLVILTSLTSGLRCISSEVASGSRLTIMPLKAMDFEVHGRVQGVFFRKYTKKEADKLGLRGWCMNTAKGTVLGHMQGPADKVENMIEWLRNVGSPSSRIDKAEFRNQRDIEKFAFENFEIRRDD